MRTSEPTPARNVPRIQHIMPFMRTGAMFCLLDGMPATQLKHDVLEAALRHAEKRPRPRNRGRLHARR